MGAGEATSDGACVLEVLDEDSRVVQQIPVSGYSRIGRRSAEFKADVLIPDECTSASRQHAVMDLRGDRPILEDRSRFGTIVNGIRLERSTTELSDRDEIIFGEPGDGWHVRFRFVPSRGKTTPADPLEMLVVSENPRQVRIGHEIVDENLGRDAFHLLRFLSENKGSWYPTRNLVDLLWPGPDGGPSAANQAISKAKKRANDLLRPYLRGEDAIESWPHRGYRLKPRIDGT